LATTRGGALRALSRRRFENDPGGLCQRRTQMGISMSAQANIQQQSLQNLLQ
jgi:hypothetical protein